MTDTPSLSERFLGDRAKLTIARLEEHSRFGEAHVVEELLAEIARLQAEVAGYELAFREGRQAARNFGAEIADDDEEPKWWIAAAIVAERNRVASLPAPTAEGEVTYTEVCRNPKCPRGGLAVEIRSPATGHQKQPGEMDGEALREQNNLAAGYRPPATGEG